MKLRKLVSALALASLACVAPVVNALTIDGIDIPVGATFSTVTLFEGERLGGAFSNGNGVIDVVGEELVGVGFVNQIFDNGNNLIWSNGQNGRMLSLIMSGFTAVAFTPIIPAGTNFVGDVLFKGGSIQLYSRAAGSFTGAGGTQATVLANAGAGAGRNLWLDLAGSASGPLVGADIVTLQSTLISSNPLVFPATNNTNISGKGFLDAVGGLALANFDTNTFSCIAIDGPACAVPDIADMKFTSSGQVNPIVLGSNEFPFRGTGEISSFNQVPAPGSLALVGLGMFAAGFVGRRKQKSA